MNAEAAAVARPSRRHRTLRAILLTVEAGLVAGAIGLVFTDGSRLPYVYALLLASCTLEGLYIPFIRDTKRRAASLAATLAATLLVLAGVVGSFWR